MIYCVRLEGEDHHHHRKVELLHRICGAVKRCASELVLLAGDFNCEWPEDALGERSPWDILLCLVRLMCGVVGGLDKLCYSSLSHLRQRCSRLQLVFNLQP